MENFRIESLEINKIGPFKYLRIEFPKCSDTEKAELHVLTGGNGTGKSTILESLIFPVEILKSKNSVLRKCWNLNNNNTSLILKYTNRESFAAFGNEGDLQELNQSQRLNSYFNKTQQIVESLYEIAFFAYSGYRKVETINIQGIQEIQEHPLQDAHNFYLSINPQNFIQWLVNVQTRELIAKGRGDSQKATKYRSTIEIIEKALGEIIDSEVKFDLEEEPLGVKIKVDGQTLNFDQLPDGLKSMVSWMGDLLMRMERLKWVNDTPVLERNFILLLDEIEVHLHPAWQRKILPVVQKLFKNAQIFISTHSPFVVGSVDGAWVHRFEKKDGYSVLAGPPILSEDAKSYDYILEEIFGVKERFGVEIERKLQDFQALKASFLAEQRQEDAIRLHQLVKELSGQSTELDSILGMELRQLKRLTNQDFSLTEV